MDRLSRREFCALLAASAGTISGCGIMNRNLAQMDGESSNGRVVTTRAALEEAFEDLSPGETIRIGMENAPYRTTEWLDIDVDGVTIVGPGVQDLIKPADGANVGGIRVGHNARCREIDIRGVGFHGNAAGQSERAPRLHGIAVRDATDVTIERNHVRNTGPKRHGDGGSGISVGRSCSNVRISNNRVREFGDRGIQLAGERLLVYGNTVTDGLDRPISCDLWYPDRTNSTAQHVSIFGNLLGNTIEGSLIGIARNSPLATNRGHVSIFGNVGFGTHKSFCHVRGPEALRNISIQHNVSVQDASGLDTEQTTKFAGIAVDVAEGHDLSIRNNELYDYSGHGINVDSEFATVSIQQNGVSAAGLAGIRLANATDGLVAGNLLTGTKGTGIRLLDAANVAVRGNHVRWAGASGIVASGSRAPAGIDVADNFVTGNGWRSSDPAPAIRASESGVRVRGNTVRQNGAPAVVETDGVRDNVYENNWADGERPWRIESPTATVRNNTPRTGAHRSASAEAGSDVVRVEFSRPYARRPRLSFGRVAGGVRDVSYLTDGDGDFVGAEITVQRAGGTVDVFVDGG